MFHVIFSKVYDFQPFMTRAEVYKVSVTHYFKPDKAQKELGYYPIVTPQEAIDRTVKYWQQKQELWLKTQKSNHVYNTLMLTLIILFLGFFINKNMF